MNDNKIFSEMAGIFSWVKIQHKEKDSYKNLSNKEKTFLIIKDFMIFLQIEISNVSS